MAPVTIDRFPIEVLEMIFNNLGLKDIGNCSQTCIRWEQVIARLFKDKTKLVILTGFPYGGGQNTEVIDLTNPGLRCELIILNQQPPKEASVSHCQRLETEQHTVGNIDNFWLKNLALK